MGIQPRKASRRDFLKTVSCAAAGALGVIPTIARPAQPGVPGAPLQRILFGSCNKDYKPQPLWDAICAAQPDLWIWLGDNIYGSVDNMADLAGKYRNAKSKPGYQKLRSSCPIIGTWDDNDYGLKDGGMENPHKVESQRLLLDFLDEPPDSPRWHQAGVYIAYTMGPPGRQVKIILLDGRYYRERPGTNADPLGSEQWEWLERELAGSTADVNLIGSGIQVLADEHPFEKWADFPRARDRLLDLIVSSKAHNVVLISGDRHLGEISRLHDVRLPYPLCDVTSSGMTHFAESKATNLYYDFQNEANRFRLGDVYLGFNFGMITIHWDSSPRQIVMQVRDVNNAARAEETMWLV